MKQNTLWLALSLIASNAALADSSSPWTPAGASSELSLRIAQQEADRFFAGAAEMPLPADLTQNTYTIDYSYGLSDRLALDVRVGYTKSDFITVPGLAPNGGLSGGQDSRIGVRYNFVGTEDELPTLTIGLAALIAGNYDVGALPAVGDGESGFEIAALIGHAFDSGFLLSGGITRRQFSDVPDETIFNLGAGLSLGDAASLGLFYQDVSSNGNLDIGGPGFSPARFPEVDEEFSLWGIGGSFSVSDTLSFGLDYGRKFDGKNTAKSDFISVSASTTF